MNCRASLMRVVCPLLFLSLFFSESRAQEDSNPYDGIVGTFSRSGVSTDGALVSIKRVIEAMDQPGLFLQTRTVTPAEGADIRQWKLVMKMEPLGEHLMKYRIVKYRQVLPESEAQDWVTEEANQERAGVIEVRGNFHYSTNRLSGPAQIWVRETGDFATMDGEWIEVLKPLTKTYTGEYQSQGTAAYNADESVTDIKCTGRANETGTVISFDWTMRAKDAPASRTFEAHAICTYDSSTGRITSHIYNSVGVVMKAELVRARDNKLLWERVGKGPAGEIRELCMFDFSEPGVFRHRILSRTLNGVVVDEEEADIVLHLDEATKPNP